MIPTFSQKKTGRSARVEPNCLANASTVERKSCRQRSVFRTDLIIGTGDVFCSQACYKEYIQKISWNTVYCAHCGKELRVSTHVMNESKTGNFFCNQSCAAQFNNKLRTKTEEEKQRTSESLRKRYPRFEKILSVVNTTEDTAPKVLYKKPPLGIIVEITKTQKLKKEIATKPKKEPRPKHIKQEKVKKEVSVKPPKPPKPVKVCRVCGQQHCTYPTICRAMKDKGRIQNLTIVGFDTSKYGTFEVYDEYFRLQYELYEEYHIKEKSLMMIAKEHNFSFQRLSVVFNFLKIPKRNVSDAQCLAIRLGRVSIPIIKENYTKYKFKHGWHTSWEGESWYFRSSYEENYMMYLDEQKTHYKGEGYLKIPYYNTEKGRIATAHPDFYFPDTNTIVEVKSMGTLIGHEQEMDDKFKRYRELGYTAHLLLDHVMYEDYKFV